MRKSTTTATIILLVCFGSLFLALNMTLEPLKQDAEFAKGLEADLKAQGLLAPDPKLVVLSLVGGTPKRLIEEKTHGIAIWYEPHVDTLAREDGIEALTLRILEGIAEKPPRGKMPPWVELNIEHADEVILRRLVTIRDGTFSELDPPLPEIWIPGVGGQDAPQRGSRAQGLSAGGS